MDRTIEKLICNFKNNSNNHETVELTPKERYRFNDVSSDRINQQMRNLIKENFNLESIDPDTGKVIYHDSYNRKTISLEVLGYEESIIGHYRPSQTIFSKLRDEK
ncbi:MAG: hypothetical protein ACQER9_00025 [Nanobdellota archaeon]